MKIVLSIVTSAALLLPMRQLKAQTDLTNTGILQVSTGSDILYISGSLTNASGSAFTNNGSLYVKQNLSNAQAAMAAGTGTLYLNGTATQTVSGAQLFKTYNLVTNNSAGIILNNNLDVSGAHTFTAGIITTSATPNYLIYEAGSSYSGDGDAQHVNGWVQKTGTTNFTFPVGNATYERSIAVNSLSASSVFNVKYAGATSNTGNVAVPLLTADPNEYWTINQVSGGTAQVAMNWDNSKIAFPHYTLTDIRVASYITGNWTQVGGSATGNVTTTGNITSNTIGSFGSFTFGSLSPILPVQLLQFSANRNNGITTISWTVTDEVNVGSYEVQRSDDGVVFYVIGTVGAHNLASLQDYALTDNKQVKDIAYYRLRSIDKDGRSKTSKVVIVYDRTLPGKYFVANNPVHDAIMISAGSQYNGSYNYRIMTVSGQAIQQGHLIISNGGTYSIPLSSATIHGVFVLEIQNGSFSYQQRILVQ